MIGLLKFLVKICPKHLGFGLELKDAKLIPMPNLNRSTKSLHFSCNSTITTMPIHRSQKKVRSRNFGKVVLTEIAAHAPHSCPSFDQAHPCSSTKLKHCRSLDVGDRFQQELGLIFTDFHPTAPPTDSPPARVTPFFPSFDAER